MMCSVLEVGAAPIEKVQRQRLVKLFGLIRGGFYAAARIVPGLMQLPAKRPAVN